MGDTQTFPCGLHAQEARLTRHQFKHAIGHGTVAVITGGAQWAEDDRIVRRGRGVDDDNMELLQA